MTNTRNIGLSHGVCGKGDADRTNDNAAFRANLALINWGDEPQCFERRGRKLIRTYGPALWTGDLRLRPLPPPDVTLVLLPAKDRRTLLPILYKRGVQ